MRLQEQKLQAILSVLDTVTPKNADIHYRTPVPPFILKGAEVICFGEKDFALIGYKLVKKIGKRKVEVTL